MRYQSQAGDRFIRCPLLSWLVQHKDSEGLEKVGGPEGLAKALNTSLDDGINPDAVDDTSAQRRAELFGANKFPQVPLKSFFVLLWGNLSDKILILLMIAATVCLFQLPPCLHVPSNCLHRSVSPANLHEISMIFGVLLLQISTVLGAALPEERAQSGWTEGVAIWVAVIVVSLVGRC